MELATEAAGEDATEAAEVVFEDSFDDGDTLLVGACRASRGSPGRLKTERAFWQAK